MIDCLATNVLVQARAISHPHGVLLDGFIFGLMDLAVSNRILTEYEEIICAKVGVPAWRNVARLLDLIEMSGNLKRVSPH